MGGSARHDVGLAVLAAAVAKVVERWTNGGQTVTTEATKILQYRELLHLARRCSFFWFRPSRCLRQEYPLEFRVGGISQRGGV